MGELDGRRAHAASNRVNEHSLARQDAALRNECIVRGNERFRNGGGVHEVDVIWNPRDQALVGNHILCLATAADDSENSVAGFERADGIRAQGVDFASVFEPRDVGGRAGRGWIDSFALQQVSPVQPAGPDADTDLASRAARASACPGFPGLQDHLCR